MSAAAAIEPKSLVEVLRSMAETLRDLTREFPTWSLPEAEVGAVIGQAQQVRQLSHSLTAVLAREADSRGLGSDDGSRAPTGCAARPKVLSTGPRRPPSRASGRP